MKRTVAAALAALAFAPFSAVLAAEQPVTSLDSPNEKRAGVVIGLSVGYGLAGSSGYPNSATKIDDSAYYSSSDMMHGLGQSVFVMGALSDYVNFGLWFGTAVFQSSAWRSTGAGGGFRVEGFPFYSFFPKLADLAFYTQVGIGATTLSTKLPGNYPDADGAQSFLGIGTFYEFSLTKLFGGHVAGGPSLEYDVITSTSAERHGALLGARLVFYGGQ